MTTSGSNFKVGDRVFFWTGRGSQGFGIIRSIENGRAFIDPESDALKGSDYRTDPHDLTRPDRWAPRDRGVRFNQLNTPASSWYKND